MSYEHGDVVDQYFNRMPSGDKVNLQEPYMYGSSVKNFLETVLTAAHMIDSTVKYDKRYRTVYHSWMSFYTN